MYKSEARKRIEKRCREQRREWLKDNLLSIIGTTVVVLAILYIGYRFWYKYIPSTIEATEGYGKIYIEYCVVSGDTLDGICNRYFNEYGYDRPCSFENEVICRNNLHGRISYLQVGQTIELPRIVNTEVYEPYRVSNSVQ